MFCQLSLRWGVSIQSLGFSPLTSGPEGPSLAVAGGSGHGNEFHLLVERSLYLVVEPVIDKPELSHLCTEAMPFLTYGRTCGMGEGGFRTCRF